MAYAMLTVAEYYATLEGKLTALPELQNHDPHQQVKSC